MRLLIKESKIVTNKSLLEPWLTKALLKVKGYKIDELMLTIPNEDLTVAELLTFVGIGDGYEDFPIWIEIQNQYANANIPTSFSFSTYQDESDVTVQRKVSDMEVSAAGVTNTIYYLQGITSKATVADLIALTDSPIASPLSISELQAKLNNVGGEYYVAP